MATGDTVTSRWENADPLEAIDAQLTVLTAARDAFRADLMDAEQLAVAAGAGDGDAPAESRARLAAGRAREAVRDYSAEIDELQAERHALLPTQRQP